MSARALLENPALFSGLKTTPVSCVKDWLNITERLGTHFTIFHRHLIFMSETLLSRADRRVFNILTNREDVVNYLEDKLDLS